MGNTKICTCEICGTEFEGYSQSRYCRECKPVVEKLNRRRCLEKFRAAEAQAKAKAVAKKLDEEEKRRKETFIPNTKQCKGCVHWRFMSGLNCNGCHYLLDTEKCRQRDGDTCLSRTSGKKERGAWEMPATSASTLSGYKT